MIHMVGEDHLDSHPRVNYFAIFIALCVCTLLSVMLDIVEISPPILVALVLAVAFAKALFVLTYFMHLKFEGRWKFVILAPTVILALGLVIGLAPDMAMHYYTSDAPQVRGVREVPGSPVSPVPSGEQTHSPSGN